MARGPKFYINGIDRTLNESIRRMRSYHARYVTVGAEAAESLFTGPNAINTNEFSPRQLRRMVLDRMKPTLDPTRAGKIQLRGPDGKVRNFDPQSWSETIARTRSRDLQEEGLHNEMIKTGFDLVIVSSGRVLHELCSLWENRILSVTGKTPGYPTVAQAKRSGLWHPRCVHSSSPLILAEDEVGPSIIGRDVLPPKARREIREASDWAIFKRTRRPKVAGPPPKKLTQWDGVRVEVEADLEVLPSDIGFKSGAVRVLLGKPQMDVETSGTEEKAFIALMEISTKRKVKVNWISADAQDLVRLRNLAVENNLLPNLDAVSARLVTRLRAGEAAVDLRDEFNVFLADYKNVKFQLGLSEGRTLSAAETARVRLTLVDLKPV